MTGTGKSSTEIVAEAVGAIGPYMAWIAHKRAEIQGQIAQMQAAAGTTTLPGESSQATRLRGVALPTTGRMSPSESESHAEATVSMPPTDSGLPQADTHRTPAQDAAIDTLGAEGADTPQATHQAARPATPEEPVTMPEVSNPTPTATSTTTAPQNRKEAQAQLEAAFAATPPHTLPPVVVAAWAERRSDSRQCAKLLIAAQDSGLLPDELAQAVTTMIAWADEFAAVSHAYADGRYPDLVGVFAATVQSPAADSEDDGEAQNEEDGDEAKEEGEQYGFAGEDQQEHLF